ncbi:MAG: PKD domain-containing protein [Bacteroidetes bacterium]|nr:PKD domain-containing protein [Bacteroidota bacterium]
MPENNFIFLLNENSSTSLYKFFVCNRSCKKDKESDSAPNISFTYTSGYTNSLPKSVVFTANSSNADNISWDFGDSTTGQGFTVSHTYNNFGAYKVKATATKSGLSASYSKDVPITFHRRAVIKKIEVLQIPSLKPGGLDWDPGEFPDLTYEILFPGDTLYVGGAVLNNSETGSFNIIPSQGTYVFDQDVKIKIYDKDVGNVPDKELMGIVPFKFTSVLPTSLTYTDSVQVIQGALKLLVKFEFQQ